MTPQNDDAQRSAGRPRDPRIEQAALTATRELLVEVGYAAPHGRRRRRPRGDDEGSALPALALAPPPGLRGGLPRRAARGHGGSATDLRADLLGIVTGTRDAFTHAGQAAAALPGLVAEFSTAPRSAPRRCSRASPPSSTAFDDRLRAAADAGEVRPDTRAEDLMRLMIGAVLLGVMLGPDDARRRLGRPDRHHPPRRSPTMTDQSRGHDARSASSSTPSATSTALSSRAIARSPTTATWPTATARSSRPWASRSTPTCSPSRAGRSSST